MKMVERLKEKDIAALEAMFVAAKGRGFEPRSMRAAVIRRGLISGMISKADSDFFFQRRKGTHIIFTAQGKARLIKRIAERHRMDEDDALHLVRTGNFHLITCAVKSRREAGDESGQQVALLG